MPLYIVLRCGPAFRNEGNAYQVVVPALEGFTYSRLPFPECLHAASDCLILEDLKVAGFRMADRRRGLDFLQASLAIKVVHHMNLICHLQSEN